MIVLFGASASGKTEVAKMLEAKYNIKKVVTCTTREKRLNEKDGVDYYFLTEEEIKEEYKNKKLIEMTLYNGNYYGTRFSEIQDNKVLILDPKGVSSFSKLKNDHIVIFYLQASPITRFNRMLIRQDSIEAAHSRIDNDSVIFDENILPKYDYLMNTDENSIEEIANQIYKIYIDKLRVK